MPAPGAEPLSPQLVGALRAIVGPENVIAGEEELMAYECDDYMLEKRPPGAVVLPKCADEVCRARRMRR